MTISFNPTFRSRYKPLLFQIEKYVFSVRSISTLTIKTKRLSFSLRLLLSRSEKQNKNRVHGTKKGLMNYCLVPRAQRFTTCFSFDAQQLKYTVIGGRAFFYGYLWLWRNLVGDLQLRQLYCQIKPTKRRTENLVSWQLILSVIVPYKPRILKLKP